MDCPFCGFNLAPLKDTRFAVCKSDRVVWNLAYAAARYERDYFDKEYEAQYGRSYVADRDTILARNQWRYDHLKNFIGADSHPRVLEVGSAAGYFLKIMQEKNHSVEGWEISQAMSKYANARGLKTLRQDFAKGARAHAKRKFPAYDVLALFYVLEHLPDQPEVWRSFGRLLRPGGFLALAIPSAAGPTFRYRRDDWFRTHPEDHAIDYTPAGLKIVGKKFGFTVRGAWSEGIHPQRFPLGKNVFFAKLYKKMLASKPVGDTIYAILEHTG